jgi:hypothetical protein
MAIFRKGIAHTVALLSYPREAVSGWRRERHRSRGGSRGEGVHSTCALLLLKLTLLFGASRRLRRLRLPARNQSEPNEDEACPVLLLTNEACACVLEGFPTPTSRPASQQSRSTSGLVKVNQHLILGFLILHLRLNDLSSPQYSTSIHQSPTMAYTDVDKLAINTIRLLAVSSHPSPRQAIVCPHRDDQSSR